jgi:hypothetical protein
MHERGAGSTLSSPQWVARPNDLPNSDLTNAFTEEPNGAASTFAYGFNVDMVNLSQDGRNLTAGQVKQAGFGSLEQQVRWDETEKAPGQ